MRRREFVGLLAGAAAAWPLAAHAQQRNMPRIGILAVTPPSHPSVAEMLAGLRDLGYVEGRNIAFEIRSADGPIDRFEALASDLVRLNVAVLVTHGPEGTRAAAKATHTIPIVMARMDDADLRGFVANLARPGGNITGLSFQTTELSAKWLELMKEVLPPGTRIAVLSDATGTFNQMRAVEQAARTLAVDLHKESARNPDDFANAFAAIRAAGAGGLVILGSPLFTVHMHRLVELAASHRLATMYVYRTFTVAGGLMSYGPSETDRGFSYRRAAFYIDRLLKGAKAADLPVEQPTKFELVINLKTAKALGLDVPWFLQQRADEVIE